MSDFKEFMDYDDDLADQLEESTRSKRSGGGGGYSDLWKPPKEGEGEVTPIVLFKGDYTMELQFGKNTIEMKRPFFTSFEHFFNTKKTGIACSAGLSWEKLDDGVYGITVGHKPCVACHHLDEGIKGMSRRKMQTFNAILLEWFHMVDSERTSKQGKAFKNPISCTGKKCPHCKAGIEKTFGRRVFWGMGKNHSDTLKAFQRETLNRTCQCSGKIKPVAFTCRKCGAILRDLEEDPPARGELTEYRSREFRCPECKTEAKPKEEIECSKCKDPKKLTMWDVVIEPIRVGENTASTLQISNWGLLEPKLRKSIEDRMKPFDFTKVMTHKILSTAEQAKKLDLANPFDDSDEEDTGVVPGSKTWSDDDGLEADSDSPELDDYRSWRAKS